jgi:hypothetical protein
MMIGMLAVAGRLRTMRQTSVPLSTGRLEVEDDDVGRLLRYRAQRRVAAGDDVDLTVAGAFERVLDEPGDIVPVLDDQDARERFAPAFRPSAIRSAAPSREVIPM